MPIFVYVMATLVMIVPMRRSFGNLAVLRDPIFWSAVALIYLGPLTILASRQLGMNATFPVIGCLGAGLASLVLIVRDLPRAHGSAVGPRIALATLGLSLFMGTVLSGTISTSFYRDLPTYYALLIAGILVGHRDLTRRFVVGTVWAILATSFGSLALYVSSPDLVTTNFTSFSGPLLHTGRLTGPFGHPNAVGTLSAVGAALSLTMLHGRSRYLAYGLCLTTVFLSDQRSALIAALICGILHVAWPARRSALTWLRTNLLVLGVLALLFTNVIYENVNNILNRREASVESRQQVYDFVLSNLSEILPFGIGVNGLYDRTAGILSRVGFSHAHNAWLSFLVAGGIAGGLCFLLLSLYAIGKSLQAQNLRLFPPLMTVVILSLAESPTYAGSNWTLISVASVCFVIMISPIAPRLNSEPPPGGITLQHFRTTNRLRP